MIGLDLGQRRIGVAVSDGRVAVPLSILQCETLALDIARIEGLVREQEASAVVIGLPITMAGEERAQARGARKFGAALARRIEAPVVFQDERLSSAQVAGAAGRRMAPRNASRAHPARRRGKPRVDDLAAAVILQAYIDGLEAGV